MRHALKEARCAYDLGEVPVGAVLVFDGEVIARAHNIVESNSDATHHAELLCLQQAARQLRRWRLLGCTLYSTLEPCSMCVGAMFLSRIDRLVWGAPDHRHGAHGSWVNLFGSKHPTHHIQVASGVLAQESSSLMRSFFQERRNDCL